MMSGNMTGFPLVLCLALLLDILLGDPRWLPHPVVGIGRVIGFWERRLYPGSPGAGAGSPDSGAGSPDPEREMFRRGLVFCLAVLASTGLAVGLLLLAAARSPALSLAVQTALLYLALAWRSLKDETLPVALTLFRRDLPGARTALSRVVGRDTDGLPEDGIARAAVETVAENAVDGVLSVLFCAALGWALGGGAGGTLCVWLFKAASTLDSMVGYDNARYHAFGRASARLDDALNFIPARLGGLVIVMAGACVGCDARGGLRVLLRDRKKHRSPNSAHGESAFAGLLGLRLGGGASYGGAFEPRPWLGDGRDPEPADVLRAHRLLDASTALWALLLMLPFILP